jgi:hypothetical protein
VRVSLDALDSGRETVFVSAFAGKRETGAGAIQGNDSSAGEASGDGQRRFACSSRQI